MFDWDDANLGHIAEHGVSSAEAEQVILNDPLDLEYESGGGEERLRQVGETLAGRLLVIVITWRGEKTRVVTAYPASRILKTIYLTQKGIQHGRETQDS
jgi:uncharacterized DUF497 family protein